MDEYDEIVCLEGPLERVNGELALMIPLEEGGDKLREVAQKISEIVEGNILKIVIKPWLAGVLRIEEGDLVQVDNQNGKFNLRAVKARLGDDTGEGTTAESAD